MKPNISLEGFITRPPSTGRTTAGDDPGARTILPRARIVPQTDERTKKSPGRRMNKRSRGHAKRGPPEVRSRARLREAAVLLPTRAGDGRDCCLFLPPNFLDSSAPTLIRDARRELQSNRTITSHIHHPFERSRTPPAPNVATFFRAFPRSSRARRRRRSFLRVFWFTTTKDARAALVRLSPPPGGRLSSGVALSCLPGGEPRK